MSDDAPALDAAPVAAPRTRSWIVPAFAVTAIAFSFYLRLFLKAGTRSEVFAFFLNAILPAVAIHTSIFLVMTLGFGVRARGALAFWAISILGLLYFGSWTSAQALALIVLFGLITTRTGKRVASILFPPESQNWGLSLGIGILLFSFVGAYLAWIHAFYWWVWALIILAALIPELSGGLRPFRNDLKAGWAAYQSNWNVPMGLSLQALFLLGAFVFVGSMAPETNSDAVRFYWPYLKLLRHYAGFFDGPRTWSYLIPQAGLIYGSAVFSLIGKHAVRLAMGLAWVSLIGIMCRPQGVRTSGVRFAIAVIVASCPVVLWITSSLMQDCFVCLAVLVFGVLCIEGRNPGRLPFWIAIGVAAATCWASKYSTLTYAAPLLLFAAYRGIRDAGWLRTLRASIVAGGCAIVTLVPWFVHSYVQCKNPFFPFLLGIFPSPIWPRGVGFANLDRFRLASDWRGWLLWPIDMTYHTSRFVEGYDGKLGLTLIVILLIAIAAIWKGSRNARVLAVSGAIATGLLWSQTAYLRYWMPSLWLIGMVGSEIFERHLRSSASRIAVSTAAFLILLPQVLFGMVNYWPDPQGWPWKTYIGKVPWESIIGMEVKDLERLLPVGNRYPKVWFTGYEPVGHLLVQPMEAVLWELTLHTTDQRSKLEYLTSGGAEYWIVNEADQDALWFRGDGIAHFFWNPENLIGRVGSLAVYRMPSREKVLQEFDARSALGTELLLNGSFEEGEGEKPIYWFLAGEARRITSDGGVLDGQEVMQLKERGGARQGIAVPPGTQSIEVVAHARSASPNEPVAVHYVCYFVGFPQNPAGIPASDQVQPTKDLTGRQDTIVVRDQWQSYHAVLPVPDLARTLFVSIDKPVAEGEAWIDSVQVYVR